MQTLNVSVVNGYVTDFWISKVKLCVVKEVL